jgi:diacylglycerol kinase (ATP)
VVDVDLGVVGDDHFVNVASVGLSVGVTEALSPVLKRRVGALAYPIAALRAYRRHEPFRARLEFPDGDHEPVDLDDLLQVAVANGRFYGGGNVVAPNAGIDDHLLDVYAIPRGTAWQRWQVIRHFISGAFTERDHVLHLTTRSVRLITEPEQRINVDGELSARTPVQFGLLRNGLKVMVPQSSDAAQLDA